MDDLENLELLSLVSKITSELENHLGVSDKTLAEFIIHQHSKCKSLKDFKDILSSLGADFPQSLIESIDRLVLTLHPKHKIQAAAEVEDDDKDVQDRKTRVFKGLVIPDQELKFEDEEPEATGGLDALDDTFAMLENLAGKPHGSNGHARKRSRSPDDRDRKTKRYRNDEFIFEDIEREKERARRHDEHRKERRRRRSGSRERRHRRSPSPQLDDEPVLYKIYNGMVTGVKHFGVFVNLKGVRGKVDGLVHIGEMKEGVRINHPSDLVERFHPVKVKVISVENGRIGLSMKQVDQSTGEDLRPPQSKFGTGANSQALGGRFGNLAPAAPAMNDAMNGHQMKQKKRLTSPERWEIKQLMASGAISRDAYPDIDEDFNAAMNEKGEIEEEEDVDIEVREEEPPFLAGQTKQSLELSPIRVVKAPDGSLNRAAMAGESLARERKQIRQEEDAEKAAQRANETDLSSQWQDPMVKPDQRQFASELRSARPAESSGPTPAWKRITSNQETALGKRTSMSIKEQRENLPVYRFRKDLLQAVQDFQLLIVVGDTGSGKTTQLTQYLAEDGWANEGMIGCTQPRRVAAMSVAQRVSEEVGCKLGHEVGYTIRFEDCTSSDTKIKYMTDGILQREILLDPMLQRYSVIMLDEAHERTIATDVLFGLLKKTLKRRSDLKLIVTSATLDADKFSEYFNKCPILTIPGRTYPVEILYSREPESDYLDSALNTVMDIHQSEPPGDILLFLTGREEIDSSCEILDMRMKALGPAAPELIILPIYSALPSEVASRIFEPAPAGSRKVVIATNIAETSITIDGIYYVIDPGFVKQNAYDAKLGMDRLQVTPISQAQAKQRAGRAGRTGPGKCFRLYTEAAFKSEMLPTTIPEIQRQNLSNTILMLKAMGINDLLHFDFMDPPPTNTMLTALEELYALSALDDEGLLTRLGRQMADFPMDPGLAKTLIASSSLSCSDEVLSIVAMISAVPNSVFYRPREKQQQADQKKAKFHDPHGDHLTLLNVYNAWRRNNSSPHWCTENFIQARSMRRVADVRTQLVSIFERHRLPIVSCGRDTSKVRRSLCAGFFRNAARKASSADATSAGVGPGGYVTLVEGTPVHMHPSSALFGKPAEHVVYHSLVESTKEYMHNVTTIEPKWLVEAAPTFFRVAPTDRLSKRKKAERIKPLYNKYAAEDDWRLSTQRRQGRGGAGTWG